MTDDSNTHAKRKRRLLRIPPRKGLGLFDYDQVKYQTPFQNSVAGILGCLALAFGAVVLSVMWRNKSGSWLDLMFAIAALAYGLLNAPVGVTYWLRRWRGGMTSHFDYEVVGQENEKSGEESP